MDFEKTGIALVSRRWIGRASFIPVRGTGSVLSLEEDGWRIRLQVSFDEFGDPATAPAPQDQAAPPAALSDAPLKPKFHERLNGGGLPSETVVILPVTSENSPGTRCLAGAGLFTATPNGFEILFPRRRSELPFKVEERVSPQRRNVAFAFSTPTCRMTIEVEQEVRNGSDWVRLAPVE